MNLIVDIVYLGFAVTSLYFTFLFLLLFLKNRKKLYDIPTKKKLPSVSIIIPAYNEEKSIGKTIKAVKKLIYPKNLLETIVVDDGSTDRTFEMAKRFRGIRVLTKKHGGKAAALNFAVRKAGGEVVACIDSDSYPKPDALLKSVTFFDDRKVGAVTSSIFVDRPKNLLQRLQWIEYTMIVWSRKLLEFMDSVYVTPGALSLYRKSALKRVGGFDEKNMTEDIEIAWRLMRYGYSIKMASPARAFTTVPGNLKKWWRQRLRWSIGGIQTTLKYKYTFLNKQFRSLGTFVLPFFLLSYFLSLLGLGVFLILVGKWVFDIFSFSIQAYAIGLNPMKHVELFIVPDVFTFFGILIFALSIVWVKISLNVTKERASNGLKSLLDLLIYLSIYITSFPFILVHSIWRFICKKYKW
jgi:cellulose synthase/poly-beta-1,6-N-acetylglucosamine synthase-like glycosyltransferase